MIKYIYCYRSRVASLYNKPFTMDFNPDDIKDLLFESYASFNIDELQTLMEDDLYYIGSFDNKTGLIVPANKFILDVSTLARQLIALKKENKSLLETTEEKANA